MADIRVKSCCRCGSLRTGTLITAVLGIILAILTIIMILILKGNYRTLLGDWLGISQTVIRIILIVNLCMTILISILLIIGTMKRNHYLMLPWVILGFMVGLSLLISVIVNTILYAINGEIITAVCLLIIGLLYFFIYAYLWVVVYSHFAEIREENNRGRYNKQPYRR